MAKALCHELLSVEIIEDIEERNYRDDRPDNEGSGDN
jgi:hypothetical protein